MAGDIVIVARYLLEHEAELARATLEAEGIQAAILADNAGGMIPGMQILFPMRLAVAEEDAERAREILSSPEPLGDDFVE